ncbi:FAD-dependent oxidoreductase [bacterium]|nr:FAD-dependent oxidoreductase [bacterium]
MKRIVILGGGFGGVYTALHLEKLLKKHKDSIEIILVNRENYFTYQPMLAEVVGGSIDILDSVTCLRSLLKHTSIYIRDVTEINIDKQTVSLSPNFSHKELTIKYDHLVLGLGTVTDFRTSPGGLAEHALPFKDLSDAVSLRNRIIDVIETAAQETDPVERRALLTFVVGGGGFSGVEVVAEINDLARKKVKAYKSIDPKEIRVILVHSKDRLVDKELSPSLGDYCGKLLQKRGIEVMFGSRLTSATPNEAIIDEKMRVKSKTVVSTVPSIANPLIEALDLEKEYGKVKCDSYLNALGKKNIWAIGDCAFIPVSPKKAGEYSPPTAQFATRQAPILAHNIKTSLLTGNKKTFTFKSLGQMAALGHKRAVAEILGIKLSGILAWFVWRFIYLMKIPGVSAKFRIALSWFLDMLIPTETVQLKSKPKKGFDNLHYADGDAIFHAGDTGDFLYIITKGKVDVIKNGEKITSLHEGEYFGEMALLSEKKRTATIKASGPCKILAIKKDDFNVLMTHFEDLKKNFERTEESRKKGSNRKAEGE